MRRKICQGRPPPPVPGKVHSARAETPGDDFIVVRPEVPEEVSDVHVRCPGEGKFPVQDPGDFAVQGEDVAGVVVAVDELVLSVELLVARAFSVEELLAPVAAGSTLDELGVQAGDRILLREGSAPRSGGLSPAIISAIIGTLTAILINSLVRY